MVDIRNVDNDATDKSCKNDKNIKNFENLLPHGAVRNGKILKIM